MLNTALDNRKVCVDWRVDDRLRIANILEPSYAQKLQQVLTNTEFNTMLYRSGEAAVIPPGTLSQLPAQERAQLQQTIMHEARQGIGFFYQGLHLDKTEDPVLKTFLKTLNEPKMLDFIRTVTGIKDIKYADAQATQYQPGHYLTRHSDKISGETRRIAYVINLTPTWHPDWGGLLQFYENDGTTRDSWTPGMNVLSLFDVRHIHSVSFVTPFAGAPRHAITGWFRA